MTDAPSNGEFKGTVAARLDEHGRRLSAVEGDLHEHVLDCPVKEAVRDHEKRLRTLEATRWQIIGVLGAVQLLGVGVVLAAMRAWIR